MTWMVPVIEFSVSLCWLVLLEQGVAWAVIALWQRRHPVYGSGRFRVVYQRSLFTPAGGGVGGVWLALVAAAFGLIQWADQRPWTWGLAAIGLLVAVMVDLRTRAVMLMGGREICWHRGLGVRSRSVAMRDVAQAVVVTHPALAWASGLAPLTVCQLVLELHTGRRIRLPRTGWLTGGWAVQAAARRVQRGRQADERRRLRRLRERMTVLSRARAGGGRGDEWAQLQRELHRLELSRRQDRHAAARRLHFLVQSARRDQDSGSDSRLWAPTLVAGPSAPR